MEGARPRRRFAWIALGIVVIAVALCWSLFWWLLAVFVSTFAGDAGGWLFVYLALAAGVLLFALGVGLVLGRRPGGWGWFVVGGYAVLLFAVPVGLLFDEDAGDPAVDRAVERQLVGRRGVEDVHADCEKVDDNPDGTEWFVCSVESPLDVDSCSADVSRAGDGTVVARVHDCLSEEIAP